MGGILYVCGDDDQARSVFANEHRGYWAAALPLVLEKHGYLDVEVARPSALADPRTFEDHTVVLGATVPAAAWDPELVDRIADGNTRARVLVEGPLRGASEHPVARALGVTSPVPCVPAGLLDIVDAVLRCFAARFGEPETGKVAPSNPLPIKRHPEKHWPALATVPITSEQALAWRAAGWDAERWSHPAGRVLASWRADDEDRPTPAIAERGHLIGCSFGLFSFLGQRHTSAPSDGAEHLTAAPTLPTEAVLHGLVDRMYARSGRIRPRVLPWPAGKRWALSVRHDFDRVMTPDQLRGVVAGHAGVGSSATWYWRARHAPLVPVVARSPHHEVALHTEQLWLGTDERKIIEAATGTRTLGTAAHGAVDCFRYQGAPNVLWAEAQGMLYTELLEHWHCHPHRFAALQADGTIRALEVICLPHHESFEDSAGHTYAERVLAAARTAGTTGALLQVMNHPDRNTEALFGTLAAMDDEGRLDWTAAEVAKWWRCSHSLARLHVTCDAGGTLEVTGELVPGLTVELLKPDGSCETCSPSADGARGALEPTL